jgi:PEP-CTERM motif
MKRVRALVVGSTLVFLLTAVNANARSFSLGSVAMDWRALTFSGISILFVPGELSSAVDASALSSDVSDLDASAASGWRDLSASATATTFVNDGGSAEASGSASTTDAAINAFARNSANRVAGRAASDANASLMESPNVYSVDVFDLDPRLEGVGSISNQISEFRTVSRFFEAGQQGRFRAHVGADGSATSVPEPSSLLLIGSAFALLQGLKRHRRSVLPRA